MSTPTTTDSADFYALEGLHDADEQEFLHRVRDFMKDVRVDEADRLANANSFSDTAEVLRMTRAGVAWMAVGCARGAYDNALAYAVSREQFGRPIAGFQLVQDLLMRMLGNITSWALCEQCRTLRRRR
jgi:glutaryl-CoA dehydrogenase